MSKSLKVIQTIYQIAKILSKIVFITCIIGFAGCIIGIVFFEALGDVVVGEVTIKGLIETSSELSVASMYDAMISGALFCAAECVIAKFASIYFANELKDGMPFTKNGYKELFRLSIIMLSISIGVNIIVAISHGVISALYENVEELNAFDASSITTGVAMMFLSLIYKTATEQIETASFKGECVETETGNPLSGNEENL